MKHYGIKSKDVEKLKELYGSNSLSKKNKNSFLKLLVESFSDPIIRILLIALAIKIVFLFKDFDWFETIGILIAVFLSTFISTISEYGSEAAFNRLQEESSKITVKVLRDNSVKEIPIDEVVVTDVILLSSGDKIPADGYLIEGNLSVDESSLNGESKEARKTATNSSTNINKENEIYRGSVVYSGIAKMLVTKVGSNTLYGNLAEEIQESEPTSPLKLRLRGLANVISKIGYIGAFLVTFSYLFSVIVIQNNFNIDKIVATTTNFPIMMDHLIYSLTLSVTIIVVAVPEGLPMMITLVLSSNMKRMLKNNVLVRRLVGIETTGSLNYLLTDKTGTLTKGKLSVTSIIDGNLNQMNKSSDIEKYPKFYQKFYYAAAINNASMYNEKLEVIGGNATDKCLLSFVKPQKTNPKIVSQTPFDSKNKYSTTTILEDNQEITYIKGASEKLLPFCSKYLTSNGEEKILLYPENIKNEINKLTKKGYRIILLGYYTNTPYKENKNITFIGLVCIRDELRPEAKEGIENIKNAGIKMIMITGDHPDTAKCIAEECHLLSSAKDLVLTSNDINKYSDEELIKLIPNIRVIARALPQDKSRLVKIIQSMNQVVGMTGDGVNDAPALKKANVGFAMGSGTEVSKEAADIVILDDNILSISKAILYGRTIFKSIRKFIIYQLTCNMCALFLSIIGPFIGFNTPITIIQMLWINMIMDSFAGLAFSFEPPLEETMKEPPKSKKEPIMNKYMYSQVIFTGIYSALLCIAFLKLPLFSNLIRPSDENKYLMTAYFALFIFIGVCNAFNARTNRLNIFAHLKENIVFLITIIFICVVQCYLIYHGGDLFRTYGLTAFEFAIVLILAISVIPIDFIRKLYMKKKGYSIGV